MRKRNLFIHKCNFFRYNKAIQKNFRQGIEKFRFFTIIVKIIFFLSSSSLLSEIPRIRNDSGNFGHSAEREDASRNQS